ncbi:MAG: helix-turn-helix domain-containing protein, partial [Anaeroplasmataceae bacterium]|nr:helix-turn-helix domain-containing protein [Anaeroplasmataceae bacterium]
MEFKDKLKKMRTEKNLTQDALAKILFVSRSAIAKWEAGLGLPASDSLENLCSYFSVSKEELLGNIYREDDLIHRNLTIAKQKRKIVVLSFSTIIFLLLGIIFLGILFGNKENDEF